MPARMDLIGVSELLTALKELPTKVEQRAVQNALIEAAEPVADEASTNAPHLTGTGARSIIATKNLKPSQESSKTKARQFETRAFIGPTKHVRQMSDAEFGTRRRRQKTTKRDTGQEGARPFLRPAFDGGWRGIIERFGPILGVEIKLAFERVYKKIPK